MARVGYGAVLLPSGKVLVAGGWIGHGVTDEAEQYDPASGKLMTETLLRDGRVLLAGGYAYSPDATAQTWIYRP